MVKRYHTLSKGVKPIVVQGKRPRNRSFAERTALDIQWLENNVLEARLRGNVPLAERLTDRALDLRSRMSGVLKSDDAHPLRSLEEAMTKADGHLESLLELASGKGLNVNPANG